jgi:hypothetical protein
LECDVIEDLQGIVVCDLSGVVVDDLLELALGEILKDEYFESEGDEDELQ